MKNLRWYLIVFIFYMFSNVAFANSWEIGFKVVNNGSPQADYTIGIYKFNLSTGAYDHVFDVTTSGSLLEGANAYCDQRDYNGNVVSPYGYSVVPFAYRYLFKFGNNCVIYQLPSPNDTNEEGYWDFGIQYEVTTGQFSEFMGNTSAWSSAGTTSWNDTYTFTLKNDFNTGDILLRNTSYVSGTQLTRQESSFPHEVSASEDNQTVNISGTNYKVYFRYWATTNRSPINNAGFDLGKSDIDPNPSTNDVTAYFARVCNLTFEYSFEGTTRSGYMTVGDTTRYLSATIYRRSDATLTAEASSQEYNSVLYSLDHWNKNGSNIGGTASYTFQPDIHATYSAYLKPSKPTNTYRDLAFKNPDDSSPTAGNNIRINWSTHPDNRVDGYKIWRKVKHNGVVGDSVLLSTVGSGTTYYIDYDYVYTDGYTDDIVYYDVRAKLYYNSTYSYPDALYEAAFGKFETSREMNDKPIASIVTELPTDYSISNYPNPFNPMTTINYQLPENGFVTIKVYDLLGKEVATLVNESRSAGYHRVNFDASKLTSGVYVYTITANDFIQSKKMLLMK